MFGPANDMGLQIFELSNLYIFVPGSLAEFEITFHFLQFFVMIFLV